jgi:hypothetical protein
MRIPAPGRLCEGCGVNAARQGWGAPLVALIVAAAGFNGAAQPTNNAASSTSVPAQSTNTPPATNSTSPRLEWASQGLNEAAFRIIAERNIFNANRSGGPVRLETRRPKSVETFTLVGTMAYEKGAFAFFEGSRSEFTKVLKPEGVIAGHKLVDIYANSVKIEADGKEIELPVGSQMRREDEGAWQVAEAHGGGYSSALSADGESFSRSTRSDRGRDYSRSRRESGSASTRGESPESRSPASANASSPSANQEEILKRLMERREKE